MTLRKQLGHRFTSPKSIIDTQNDVFFHVYPFKHGVILGINSLDLRGVCRFAGSELLPLLICWIMTPEWES